MSHDDISSSPDTTVHRTKTKNGAWVRMGIREQRPAELRKMGGGAVRQTPQHYLGGAFEIQRETAA